MLPFLCLRKTGEQHSPDNSRRIPARPFLGLTDKDDEALAKILQNYLADSAERMALRAAQSARATGYPAGGVIRA